MGKLFIVLAVVVSSSRRFSLLQREARSKSFNNSFPLSYVQGGGEV